MLPQQVAKELVHFCTSSVVFLMLPEQVAKQLVHFSTICSLPHVPSDGVYVGGPV